MQSKARPIQYVAQVAPVKEVTLHGLAELAFWRDKLRGEDLLPMSRNGQAQIFISATEARFLGIRFRECIIGIHVQCTKACANDPPAMYLLHAWNSLRAFAWIERNMFGTPYYAGQIRVEPQFPAQLQLNESTGPLISAAMAADAREPQEIAEENWQGAIFLPRKNGGAQKLFVAKLAGRTERFPVDPAHDRFALVRSDSCPTIDWLLESNFKPQAWHVRQAAAHAKSKTYRADQFFAG